MTGLFHLAWCPQGTSVVLLVGISLLFMAEWYSIYGNTTFVDSLADGHLGYSCLLAVVNNTAVNMGVPTYFWACFQFFRVCIWNCWISWFKFLRNHWTCFPQQLHRFIFPPTVHRVPLFATSLLTLVIFCFFVLTVATFMGVMVSHSGFDCISLVISGRRKWQPTPIFLPGESCGQRSLVGCRLWGRTESDTTEVT